MTMEFEILLNRDDLLWYQYLLSKDPISPLLNTEEAANLIECAAECGINEAKRIINDNGTRNIETLYSVLGINLIESTDESGFGILFLAKFEPDNNVRIYTDQVNNVIKTIIKIGVSQQVSPDLIKPLLLAHELYHVLENRNPNLFTENHRYTLWRVGPFSHNSRIIALSEIGATSFAKTLCDITFNPTILNYALLLENNPNSAQRFYERIIELLPSVTESR